jgi:hypothetical protein
LFETIHDVALMIDRERVGRELEARRDRGCELDARPFGARDRLLRIEMSAGVMFITYCTFCIFDAQPAKLPYASVVTTTELEVTEITETQIRAVSMENEDTNFFYFVALVTARTSPTCGT